MLSERQTGIKKLVEDEQLYKLVQDKLSTIKKAEDSLFLILNDTNFNLLSKITDRFYLESIFDLLVVSSIMSIPVVAVIKYVDKIILMKKLNKYVCDKFNKKSIILELARIQNYFNDFVVTPGMLLGLSVKFVGNKAYRGIIDENYLQVI